VLEIRLAGKLRHPATEGPVAGEPWGSSSHWLAVRGRLAAWRRTLLPPLSATADIDAEVRRQVGSAEDLSAMTNDVAENLLANAGPGPDAGNVGKGSV
jgi:hypothetical protein